MCSEEHICEKRFCVNDKECPNDFICKNSYCTEPECRDDHDCKIGHTCTGLGRCAIECSLHQSCPRVRFSKRFMLYPLKNIYSIVMLTSI